MSANEKGDCPGCTHADPGPITDEMLALVPRSVREEIESTPGRTMICGYCGCVYKINTPPAAFGYLNNPLKGKGWVPVEASVSRAT